MNNIDAPLHDNQLEKYWNNEKLKDAEKIGFVLHPEYRKDLVDPYLDDVFYSHLSYKELYNFFSDNMNTNTYDYAKEFLSALKLHAADTNQIRRHQMLIMLRKRIRSIEEF